MGLDQSKINRTMYQSQNLNRTKTMDFILSGWYLRGKNPIVSIKYITHKMKRTLRVKRPKTIILNRYVLP